MTHFKFAVINEISTTGVGFIFYFKYRGNIITDNVFLKNLFADGDLNITKVK